MNGKSKNRQQSQENEEKNHFFGNLSSLGENTTKTYEVS